MRVRPDRSVDVVVTQLAAFSCAYAISSSAAQLIAACESSSKLPDDRTRSPVMAVPGATPTDPVVMVVWAPLADTAVPACTANRAHLPRVTLTVLFTMGVTVDVDASVVVVVTLLVGMEVEVEVEAEVEVEVVVG